MESSKKRRESCVDERRTPGARGTAPSSLRADRRQGFAVPPRIKMKSNQSMSRRLAALKRRPEAALSLSERLRELADSDFVVANGATVLAPLVAASRIDPDRADLTGYEAFVNKVHVSDYDATLSVDESLIQGLNFVDRLLLRLRQLHKPFRVMLSVDPDSSEVTVRFFERRPANQWGSDNPDDYEAEDIILWDVE
jgi:hypothetical protein